MWFAALEYPREPQWFLSFAVCLLQNKRDVTSLLAANPFPSDPPQFVRARFFRYRFTTNDGGPNRAWWKREEVGEYLPKISLRDVEIHLSEPRWKSWVCVVGRLAVRFAGFAGR